jgi:CubicO group peptidase (beta-lactamase class C family)
MAYILVQHCRKCSLALIFLLFCLTTAAQSDNGRLDQWMKEQLPDLGGHAVLVLWKGGKIVYQHAENGLSQRQKRVTRFIARKKDKDADELLQDFNLDTRQRIASCSKWLSAALVMTFVDEGKLQLTDTIGQYLPVMTAKGKGKITIAQCLSHLTGIKSGDLKKEITESANLPSMEAAIAHIADMPMEGEPGKLFRYSNVGLQLAAAVIEVVGKSDFETLFAERIARPCGMTNTDFGKKAVPLAAGGAWSTPNDYIRFLSMILNNGSYMGKPVLSSKSVALMQQNYTTGATIAYSPAEAGKWGYGFGEWVMSDAAERSPAVSSPGLFGSFPWVDNQRGYAGFLFVFNIKSQGRHERYTQLKQLCDEVMTAK